MLSAVLNGKRRGTGFAGKQLALGDTSGAEDVLTATVFERLAYLPDLLLETFFDRFLGLDEPPGPLTEIQFWPSWYMAGTRVEPDVVLQGSERSLLVEAKRHDHGLQQYAQQLARELVAGTCSGELRRPVLLTLGGLPEYTGAAAGQLGAQIDAVLGDTSLDYELVCRSWSHLYLALESTVATAPADSRPGLFRLLEDIAATYAWHGLRTHPQRWLVQLGRAGIRATTCPLGGAFSAAAPSPPVLNHSLAGLPAPGLTRASFPPAIWSLRP
ncbi:hypothetical protein [Zoogloea sp.]|uniref:hypothetical protein n=1 Tax=Zoogloea sp. TaxID=49181 RepID=UPI0031FC64E7